MIASGGFDNGIHLWDSRTGNRVHHDPIFHSGRIDQIQWTADSKQLISVSHDKTVRRWKIPVGDLLGCATLTSTSSWLYSAISHDCRRVAGTVTPDKVGLWDLSGNLIQSIGTPLDRPIYSLAFSSPNSHGLAIGGQGFVLVVTTHDESTRVIQHTTLSIRAIAFSPDDALLAYADIAGVITLRDLRTGECWHHQHPPDYSFVYSLAFSPDGSMLASVGSDSVCFSKVRPPSTVHIIQDYSCSIAFSHDGLLVATGGREGKVRIRDTSRFDLLTEYQGHFGEVTSVAFSPDSTMLASGSHDTTIMVWRCEANQIAGNSLRKP
jgi:WD40 repeat protein